MKTLEEMLKEGREVQERIEKEADSLRRIGTEAYALARRSDGDMTSSHLMLSQAWIRFGGAVVQGVKRTQSVNRLVISREKHLLDRKEELEAEELKRNSAEARREKRARLESPSPSSLEDDLAILYGRDL